MSCGNFIDLPQHDSRFNPIAKEFRKDMELFGASGAVAPEDVVISFGDPNKDRKLVGLIPVFGDVTNAAGVCLKLENENEIAKLLGPIFVGEKYAKRFIVIDDDFADRPDELEQIVYHELGHCVLDKEHENDGIMDDNNDLSDMYWYRYFLVRHLMKKTAIGNPNIFYLSPEQVDPSLYTHVYSSEYEFLSVPYRYVLYKDNFSEDYYIID